MSGCWSSGGKKCWEVSVLLLVDSFLVASV